MTERSSKPKSPINVVTGLTPGLAPMLRLGDSKEVTLLWGVVALVVGCMFYSTGSFGFLNIIDMRRPVQAIFIVTLVSLSPIVCKKIGAACRNPVFLLAVTYLLAEIFLRRETMYIADHAVSVLIVGLLVCMGRDYDLKVLKCIIVLASLFSMLVIVQAVYLVANPDMIQEVIVNMGKTFSSETGAEKIMVTHWLTYLGFVSPGTLQIGEWEFFRFISFAAEPSVIVYSFLVPGLLSLSFSGFVRWSGVPILVFSMALAASGTIWLSVGLGILAFPLLYILQGTPRLSALCPFIAVGGFLMFMLSVEVPKIISAIALAVQPLSESYSAFEKTVSASVRLSGLLEALGLVSSHPAGVPYHVNSTTGMFLRFYLLGGVIGLVIGSIVCFNLFRQLSRCFAQASGSTRIMCVFLYGTFLQVLAFSDYGWNSLPGLMMLALVDLRLKSLMSTLSSKASL